MRKSIIMGIAALAVSTVLASCVHEDRGSCLAVGALLDWDKALNATLDVSLNKGPVDEDYALDILIDGIHPKGLSGLYDMNAVRFPADKVLSFPVGTLSEGEHEVVVVLSLDDMQTMSKQTVLVEADALELSATAKQKEDGSVAVSLYLDKGRSDRTYDFSYSLDGKEEGLTCSAYSDGSGTIRFPKEKEIEFIYKDALLGDHTVTFKASYEDLHDEVTVTFTVDRLRISATGEGAKGAVLDVSVLLEDGRDGTYTLENRIDGKLVETSSVSGNSIPSAGKISLRQGAASVYRISGVPYGKHEVTVSVSNGKTTAESRFTYTLDQTLLLSGTVTVGEKKTAFTLTLEDGDTGTAYGLITNLDGKETNALRGKGYDPAAKKVTFPSGRKVTLEMDNPGNGSHEMEFVLTGTDAKTSCKVPFTVETIAVRVSAEVLSTGDVEFTFTLESGDTKKQYSLNASIVNEYFGSPYELEGSTYSASTGKLSFDSSGKAVVRAVSVDPGHCNASFTLTGETGASAKASVAFEGLVPEFAVSCEYEDYGGVIETVTLVKGDRRKVYSMYVEYARVWSNFKFSGTTYEHRAMRYISSSSNTTRSFTFGLCSTEKRSEYNPDKNDILWSTKLSVATGIDGRYKATSELKVDRKGYLRFYVHYTQGYQKTLFHYNIMLKDSAHDYTGNYAIIYRGSNDRTGVNLRAVSGISGHTDHYRWAFDDREAVFELGPFKDGVTYLFNNVFSIDRYGSGDAYGLTGGCYKYNTATGLQAISESDYQNEKY